MREEALVFGTSSLVGVLTHPERPSDRSAVLLLNAGLIHRVGPSRLYVKLARALAREGFAVLRFDLSGVGDSDTRRDTATFEKNSIAETREAMDEIERRLGIESFDLIGLCSGALVAFCTACVDERVKGVACINSPGFEHVIPDKLVERIDRRQAARYYWRVALSNPKSWWKALSSRVDYQSIASAVAHAALRPFRSRKATTTGNDSVGVLERFRALFRRGAEVLLVFSEGDWGQDYVEVVLGDEFRKQGPEPRLSLEIVSSSDHIFTLRRNQDDLIARIRRWAS